jgi:hypothetical protein
MVIKNGLIGKIMKNVVVTFTFLMNNTSRSLALQRNKTGSHFNKSYVNR